MTLVVQAVTASAESLPILPKAEAGVTTVRVTKAAVGEAAAEEVYLGVQPVLDADGKMTKDETTQEYIYNTEAAEINSLACATGTITFDKATGTLTLDGVTGIQSIFSPDVGNLTITSETTPPTSDNAVASIALVALVSLAAAAMIVLRRRVHD